MCNCLPYLCVGELTAHVHGVCVCRWAQVSEELQEAHWELEEEREKRRRAEEEVSLKTHEEDNLKNRLCTLTEEREKEMERLNSSPLLEEEGGTLLPSQEQVMEQLKEERSLLLSRLKQQEELLSSVRLEKGSNKEKEGELREVEEEKSVLLSRLRQQEQLVSSLQEVKQAGDSVSSEVHALFGQQLQSLQVARSFLLPPSLLTTTCPSFFFTLSSLPPSFFCFSFLSLAQFTIFH